MVWESSLCPLFDPPRPSVYIFAVNSCICIHRMGSWTVEERPEMSPKTTKFFLVLQILLLTLALSGSARSQQARATLSGIITAPSGAAVPNAKVSLKNLATQQSTDTQADASGRYQFPNLAPGDYELSITAEGYSPSTLKVTMASGVDNTANIALAAALSLKDLGFSPAQTQGSAQEQARLDKRSHMLKIHQRLGLITTGPLVATVISGGLAGGRSTSSTDRDLHAALGSVTAGLYFTTAYYAVFAPRIAGSKTRGPIRFHKALAWIHGPGMILTPILGEMAFQQKSQGERVHGIARAHGVVGIVTAAAYGVAICSVSFKF